MARKKNEPEKLVAVFTNGDKAVMLADRLVRNGEEVTKDEMAALIKLGVVNE